MARRPQVAVPHQRFGYEQWREIVDANPDHTDIMLTRQQWDELRRYLMEQRADLAIPRDVGNGIQFEGINIHIDEDPPAVEPYDQVDLAGTRIQRDVEALRERGRVRATIRPAEVPVNPERHHALELNQNFTEPAIEEAIQFNETRFDYDNMLGIRGEVTLRNAIRFPSRGLTPEQLDEQVLEAKRILIGNFFRTLNRTPEYRNIDDTLRDFIFWLHKNIDPDKRSIADRRFAEMRNQIWPSDT